MDYDGRFIMQKTVVSTNRPVDWPLLHSTSGRLLPTGRKNYHRIIHMNVFVKPNDQSKACLCFGMARKRRLKANNPHFNRMNQRSTAAGKVKFQFEFQKIASKREPCKLVYKWPSESNLSNGEVLRLRLYEHLR